MHTELWGRPLWMQSLLYDGYRPLVHTCRMIDGAGSGDICTLYEVQLLLNPLAFKCVEMQIAPVDWGSWSGPFWSRESSRIRGHGLEVRRAFFGGVRERSESWKRKGERSWVSFTASPSYFVSNFLGVNNTLSDTRGSFRPQKYHVFWEGIKIRLRFCTWKLEVPRENTTWVSFPG